MTLEEELQDYKKTCDFLMKQSNLDMQKILYLEDAAKEILVALKDCIGDLEYTESDGYMSGQVYSEYYKDALKVINKYKNIANAA